MEHHMDATTVLSNVRAISDDFAAQRTERQQRRNLDPADFARLRDAGFLLTGVPAAEGGLWETAGASTRGIGELLRVLAHGDSSVALVAAMHPAVLVFWLASPRAEGGDRRAWDAQRSALFATARDGQWWGTITSEPGSGGDIAKTKTLAARDGHGGYAISGQKHFGSGSGISTYMVTTAVPEGEDRPDLFYMETRGHAWDGSDGMKLIAEWDGHGMAATQSHAFMFEKMPVVRSAWHGGLTSIAAASFGFAGCAFAAVIVGIMDVAMETARQQLQGKEASMRPYERVEWARAEMEHWLIVQAYEGMLRAVESAPAGGTPLGVVQGKTAIAELAESAMGRVCKVVGGGTFHRRSPLGNWFEDVRALGFLRPPWGLAYDRLAEGSLAPTPA
jgi:alkylation response protein AidB-like acyl-CoA dehydrogenase